MKKQNRRQNIFWMLSAMFAFGFFLALSLPTVALGAPTPPAECSPHADSGIGAVIPNIYDCEGNSLKGFPIYNQTGSCVTECINTGGGIVLNYGAYATEPYCYGVTKPASCTVAFSDKRTEINLQTGETKVLPPKPCDDTFCAIGNLAKNLPILIFTGMPIAFSSVVLWIANNTASVIAEYLGGLLKHIILATLNINVVPGKIALPTIEAGWKFTRDFVNLLFLLFAVFLGLATILRLENYQIKKTLPSLLIAALLVNFSGILVGIVVDFSNLLTKFFIERLGTWGGIGDNFSDSTSTLVAMLKGLIANLGQDTSQYIQAVATPIASLAVMTIFFAMLLLTLFVMMIVFIVRIAVLWVLTITAPLAFAAYAIPGAKKFWDEWIKTLVSWSIIGIPLGFFLYISSYLVLDLQKVSAMISVSVPGAGNGGLAGALTSILGPITVVAILIYGLSVSVKMAPAGAQKIISWAKGAGIAAATGGAAFLGSRALSTGIGQKILQKGMSARPMSWEELKTKNAGEARWWKRQVNSAGFGVSQALLRPTAFAISQASVSTREWNLSQNKEEIAAMETKAKKTDAVGKLGLLRNRTLTQNQRYAVLSTAAEAGELKALTDESVVGEGNTLSRGEAQEFYKRVASGKSDKDKKMEKQMRLMYAGSDMMATLDETKDAITKNADAATKTANGLTADDKALGYANTTQKTVAEAKNEEELKLLSKSVRNSDDFKAAVHDFWRGSQLEAGAKEFGRAFIQTLTEDAASRGSDHYYQVVRRGGTDANPVMRPRNTDLPRFLAGNLAQGLGAVPLEGASGPAELKQRTAIANLVARFPQLDRPAQDLIAIQKEERALRAWRSAGNSEKDAKHARAEERNRNNLKVVRASVQDIAVRAGTRGDEIQQIWSQIEKESRTKKKEVVTESGDAIVTEEDEPGERGRRRRTPGSRVSPDNPFR